MGLLYLFTKHIYTIVLRILRDVVSVYTLKACKGIRGSTVFTSVLDGR